MVGREPGLEPPADLEPIHVRHHDVQQHQIAFRTLANRKRVIAAQRGDDVEIFRRQLRFQQLDVVRHVINDQNAGGHRHISSIRPQELTNSVNELSD
jgi:hypothetical protein